MFRLPSFNVNVNLWRDATNVAAAPDSTFVGNLSLNRKGSSSSPGSVFQGDLLPETHLLCPALTDIRFPTTSTAGADVVEVPAASGRFYWVVNVEDVAKGFANEYRLAFLQKYTTRSAAYWTHTGGAIPNWPFPTP